MIELFTKDVVKDMGKNVGKTASKKLLHDLHLISDSREGDSLSTNDSFDILESIITDYKSDDKLDLLIKSFEIRGKIATFNAGQNIYNTYFNAVKIIFNTGVCGIEELEFLVEQYYRVIGILLTVESVLIKLGDKEKSQMVVEKILTMQEFMLALDKNFIPIPWIEEKRDSLLLRIAFFTGVITFVVVVFFTLSLFLEALFLSIFTRKILLVVMLCGIIIFSTITIIVSFKKKNKTNKAPKTQVKLKRKIKKAATAISLIKGNEGNIK